jgi:RimJ/RimL family protein N-acetyltransferase
MDIRRLSPADAPAYRELRLRALYEHPEAFTSSWEEDRELPLAASEQRLASAGFAFWGAFDDARALVGMVGLECSHRAKERHKGRVIGMYVAPEACGHGLGAALLAALLAHARQGALEDLVLTVTQDNGPALRLYQRAGFAPFGTEPRAIKVGSRHHAKVHMHLALA